MYNSSRSTRCFRSYTFKIVRSLYKFLICSVNIAFSDLKKSMWPNDSIRNLFFASTLLKHAICDNSNRINGGQCVCFFRDFRNDRSAFSTAVQLLRSVDVDARGPVSSRGRVEFVRRGRLTCKCATFVMPEGGKGKGRD